MDQNIKSVNFIGDGIGFSPEEYIEKLSEINRSDKIHRDIYGNGGPTKSLEEEFAKITGKEKCIYLPTGTMANHLSVRLLNGENIKVIVPENSHMYRDEADGLYSVHRKRLIPVGKGKPYFELEDLKETLDYLKSGETFDSGTGTVVIENPVRRADGKYVPIETIKEISEYCREKGYKLHLDGARIHLASAYTNTPISEYSSYFDTVYISLYKCLNTAGGAVLCGDSELIDMVPYQIKIHGGTVFQSWSNTAMAFHYLKDIESKWQKIIPLSKHLINEINKIKGISIEKIKNGTNNFNLVPDENIDLNKFSDFLGKEYKIYLGRIEDTGIIKFTVNESLFRRELNDILNVWKMGIEISIR
ncbi:MAG: aminotransferase class I/II-fold pyridoxal phosphate-dependent enzyme [Ignavibacteria bacterium]